MIQRSHSTAKSIGLLSTGDEIQNGDIVNTNAQEIAHILVGSGMQVGMHMAVGDYTTDIENAIQFLLSTHQALIITGGLGPTSDDLTRYALGHVLQKKLIFDDETWNAIVARLKNVNIVPPPESNRQQALFPLGATILPNPNGTAAGCYIEHNEHIIFMLPGPPSECLPMVQNNVLPLLIRHHYQHITYYKKWLLFGISEGHIAEELDKLKAPFACTTGYRLCYPYIEFKLYSHHAEDFHALASLVQQKIEHLLVGDGEESASEHLKKRLSQLKIPLVIADFATGGNLAATLNTPETRTYLQFFYAQVHDWPLPDQSIQIEIQGLTDYWQKIKTSHTDLVIQFIYGPYKKTHHQQIPFRGERVKQYAVEYICREISTFLAEYSS